MSYLDQTFIAIDTETTTQYPFSGEICEFAAVKWRGGKIIEEFQSLIRPTVPMSDFVISIHHITNEMVASAPTIEEKIGDFYQFIQDGILIAHHAPFDLGFLALEFERAKLALPHAPVICSSLLSRAIIQDSPNHRLKTLCTHLKIEAGQSHRALDDARACLQVALCAMDRMSASPLLPCEIEEVYQRQGGGLQWKDYSIDLFAQEKVGSAIIESLRKKTHLEIIYQNNSQAKPRQVKPYGFVRNPAGDYLIASDFNEQQTKRFYIKKIISATVIY